MKPIFGAAKRAPRRSAWPTAEGEEERVLRAVQVVVDEGIARPTLIGRPAIIAQRIEKFGLRLQRRAWTTTWSTPSTTTATATSGRPTTSMTEREGVTQQVAKLEMRRRLTLIGAMLLHKGEVDGMICGTWGSTTLPTCATSTR